MKRSGEKARCNVPDWLACPIDTCQSGTWVVDPCPIDMCQSDTPSKPCPIDTFQRGHGKKLCPIDMCRWGMSGEHVSMGHACQPGTLHRGSLRPFVRSDPGRFGQAPGDEEAQPSRQEPHRVCTRIHATMHAGCVPRVVNCGVSHKQSGFDASVK